MTLAAPPGMKMLARFLRRLLVLAAFAIVLNVAASRAANDSPGASFAIVPVPASLSENDVKDVIVATLAGRQWEVKEKTGGKVVGYLKHRGNEATVTLVYSDKQVEIFCVGYEINKKGERTKPELPKGWLNNIKSDLAKRMNVATAKK